MAEYHNPQPCPPKDHHTTHSTTPHALSSILEGQTHSQNPGRNGQSAPQAKLRGKWPNTHNPQPIPRAQSPEHNLQSTIPSQSPDHNSQSTIHSQSPAPPKTYAKEPCVVVKKESKKDEQNWNFHVWFLQPWEWLAELCIRFNTRIPECFVLHEAAPILYVQSSILNPAPSLLNKYYKSI